MTSNPTPFVVADHRRPGEPMAALHLKLPAAALDLLEQQAARLRCSRAGLARTLLLRGLEQLQQLEQQTTTAQEVA